MEEEKILLSVEIQGLDTIKKLQDGLKAAREEQKNFVIGSEEYNKVTKNVIAYENALKNTKDAQRDLNNQQKSSLNTIEGLRAKLSTLNKEWKNTELGTEQFNKLTGEIKETTDQLKKFEGAAGDTRRNVGNYKEAIGEAIAGNTGFGRSLGALSTTLKANPFSVIVIGLVGLANALKNNNEIFDQFERGLNAITTTLGVILNRVIKLGGAFIELFKGNFSEAIKIAKSAFTGLVKEIKGAVTATDEATVAQQKLDDALRERNVTDSEQSIIIAKLIRQSKDKTKTDEERLDILTRALKLERENLDANLRLADEQIRIEEARLKSSVNKEAVEIKIADARLKRNQLILQSIGLQERAENELNALEEKIQLDREKRDQAILDGQIKKIKQDAEFKKQQDTFLKDLEKSNEDFFQKENDYRIQQSIEFSNKLTQDAINERSLYEQRLMMASDFADQSIAIAQSLAGKNAAAQKSIAVFSITLDFFKELARINAASAADITQTTRILLSAAASARYAVGLANVYNQPDPQGLATGGVVSGGVRIQRNNGDNRLITARVGEVVLNRYQKSVIGDATLRRAGVPGFASGGPITRSLAMNAANDAAMIGISNQLRQQPQAIVKVSDIRDTEARVQVKDRRSSL